MTIATCLLLVNTVFSLCGLFVFFKLVRQTKKGYKMKFERVPELPTEKPKKTDDIAFPMPSATSEVPSVDMQSEMENLTMDDVMQAMRALGVK